MTTAPSKPEPVYSRSLGWCEYDEDGDSVPARVVVVPAFIGFDIFRIGQNIEHLEWYPVKEDAVDWSVDRCRVEVADHELRQAERD
jgi:hypothetical protein